MQPGCVPKYNDAVTASIQYPSEKIIEAKIANAVFG
jgi:hypothetical protein